MSDAGAAQAELAHSLQGTAHGGHGQVIVRNALPFLEPLLLAGMAPLALFPERFPRPAVVVALGLLFVPSLLRQAVFGRFSVPSPVDLLLGFMLLVSLPLSLWASPFFWTLTWPKLACLLWSVAVFYAVINWQVPGALAHHQGHRGFLPSRLAWLTWAYLAMGVAFSIMALFGLAAADKFPFLRDLAGRLPDVGRSILSRPQGVSPNEAAGMLVLFVPLALSLLLAPLPGYRPAVAWGQRFLLALLTALFAGALAFTQSRAGVLGFAAVIVFFFVALGRRGRLLLMSLGVLAAAAVYKVGPAHIAAGLVYPAPLSSGISGVLSGVSLTGRGEIWQRALYGIADFPLTGMGLGTFRQVMPVFYPFDLFGSGYDFAHAHSLYLQTALDLGLPGLAAFLLVLLAAVTTLARLCRQTTIREPAHYWLVGLGGALLGHLVYSLFDAVALGAKPGVALWFLLGLIFTAGRDLPTATPSSVSSALFRRLATLLTRLQHERRVVFVLIPASLAVLALAFWQGRGLLYLDQGNVYAARAAFVSRGYTSRAAALLQGAASAGQPYAYWSLGLLARWQGNEDARQVAQSALINTTSGRMYLLSALEPDDEMLATLALARYPTLPAALAWRAGQLRTADPVQATHLYQRALANDPGHWEWWIGLGNAYEALGAYDSAKAAYEAGCQKVIGIRLCPELTRVTSGG